MTPQRWAQIKEICGNALEKPEPERAGWLDSACGADTLLRAEVEQLLAQDEASLQSPVPGLLANTIPRVAVGDMLCQYRLEEKLGEGGMGVVYRAYDTRLRRAVALKVLPPEHLAEPESKQRLLREARAASALNHPNIVTVHEIGSEEGVDFIAMGLVEGKSLKEVIPARGLPLGKALDYAVQVVDGLAMAHAAGIIHRDLKPGNIMVTGPACGHPGLVKLLDFGLARRLRLAESETASLTAEGGIAGTPFYMSPEQARGLKVDARSDIFSLGVVLYEMIAGRRPFEGDTPSHVMVCILEKPPLPLSRYVPGIPEELQRIVSKTLEKDPEERYQVVNDLELDLKRLKQKLDLDVEKESASPPVGEPARGVSRAARIAGGVLRRRKAAGISLLVLTLVVAGLFFHSRQVAPLTDKDTILLADFVNTTGDAVFDDALKQGLSAQLEQSPLLSLLDDQRIREALGYMKRPPGERITNEIGREICQREGVKALIEGSIATLGSHFVVTLQAVNAATSASIARVQVEAESKERVLHALSGAATQLRRKLGESLASIAKYETPLEATTSSLEALKAFSLAQNKISAGDNREGIRYSQRAVELDPNFAMAYRALSAAHGNLGDFQAFEEYARRAFELRGRTSELERLIIEENYYRCTGQTDRTIETLETTTQMYPRSRIAWTHLGVAYGMTGQYEKAVAATRESLRVGESGNGYANLAFDLMVLNRFAEAKEVCFQAAARRMDLLCHLQIYEIAFMNGDTVEMKRQLEWASAQPDPSVALEYQFWVASFQGQLHQEKELVRRFTIAVGNAKERAAGAVVGGIAGDEALVGQCRQAEDDARRGLGLSANLVTLMGAAFVSAHCGDASWTLALTDRLAKLRPNDTRMNQSYLPSLRALLDIRRHAPPAIQELPAGVPYGVYPGLLLRYCRGEVYLGRRMGAEAEAEFQLIVDHRGWDPLNIAYPLAHLGLARAAAVTGDLGKSRKYYQEFLALRKDADPDLPILLAARREYTKLRAQN